MLRLKSPSAHDCEWNSREKLENYKGHSNIKVQVSVHWQAQYQAKRPRGCREFQYPAGIKPMSPNSLLLALTIKPLVHFDLQKKNSGWSYLTILNWFFSCWVFIFRLLNSNIQARQDTRQIDCKPFIDTYYCIYWYILLHSTWIGVEFVEICSLCPIFLNAKLQPTWERLLLVLARPTGPSCAQTVPQELGHWFQMSSAIVFGSDCQMTYKGSNLGSNLNSAAWPRSCKGFICSEIPEYKLCAVWILFRPVEDAKIEARAEWFPTLIYQMASG